MPARLDEAYGNHGTDLMSSISSLESLKNPFFMNRSQDAPAASARSAPMQTGGANGAYHAPSGQRGAVDAYHVPSGQCGGAPAPVAFPVASAPYPMSAPSCDAYLQHIWSCASCRNKLRELFTINTLVADTATQQTKNPFANIDWPNLVYYLLIGLGFIIVLDAFVRMGSTR